MDDLKLSNLSIDKITQFGLRPPELLKLIDKCEHYFRWFVVSKKKIPIDDLPSKIAIELNESCWVDGLQR